MNRPRYYRRDGTPYLDMLEWASDFEDHSKRIVKQDKLPNDVLVSTVFLGLDHNFSSEGPPLIFETMVFGGPLDEVQVRYATEREALCGHAVMVETAEIAGKGREET